MTDQLPGWMTGRLLTLVMLLAVTAAVVALAVALAGRRKAAGRRQDGRDDLTLRDRLDVESRDER